MKQQLLQLVTLSKIDVEIDELEAQKNEVPQLIAELESQIQEIDRSFNQGSEEVEKLQSQKRQKEMGVSEQKEWIEKASHRLTEIKTNKEYHAHLKEIEGAKKRIAGLEEDLLKIMMQIEEKSPQLGELKNSIGDKKSSVEKQIAEKKVLLASLTETIVEKQNIRLEQTKQVDPSFLERYQAIKNRLQTAMALTHAGSCLECNTRIPPQLLIELQKFTQVITCPRCHRILYLEEV